MNPTEFNQISQKLLASNELSSQDIDNKRITTRTKMKVDPNSIGGNSFVTNFRKTYLKAIVNCSNNISIINLIPLFLYLLTLS